MHTDIKFFPTLLIFAFIFTCSPSPKVANADNAQKRAGVPARWAADYVHAVVNAGRSAYSRYIVERLGKKISLHATENWASKNTLPLPLFKKRGFYLAPMLQRGNEKTLWELIEGWTKPGREFPLKIIGL